MTWFELDLTQRRKDAKTQRREDAKAQGRKERLRMTLCVLASLRVCVNFMLCSKHYLKQVLRHVKNVSLGAKGDDAA